MAKIRPVITLAEGTIKTKIGKKGIKERTDAEKKLIGTNKLSCPSYMSEEAKKEWKHIIKLYNNLEIEVLSDFDTNVLMTHCEAVAMYKKAQEIWVKYNSLVSTDEMQQRILDKMQTTLNKQQEIIRITGESLGFTPAGRARLSVAKKKEKNKILSFLEEED